MKSFIKEFKLPIIIFTVGVIVLYCFIQALGRTMVVEGCHARSDFTGTYEQFVFCNKLADAFIWGWKKDFIVNGVVYTFDKDAEIYMIKGEKQ